MAVQDYDAALILLQEYIAKKPQDFDAAQKRLKKIINSRIAFSEKAEELVGVLMNEPLEDKKKLDMIASLEALLEKNPSTLYTGFIQETKAAAQFTYYRAVFDEIMEKGSLLVEKGAYNEAIQLFYSGLDLYQKEFFEENWDPALKQEVKNKLDLLPILIADFPQIFANLNEAEKVFSEKQNNLATVLDFFPVFLDSFQKFASYQNEIQSIGAFFNNSFTDLQKENPNLTEASFLAFASRFLLGRQNSETTGIIASYNQQWNKKIEPFLIASDLLIQKEFNTSSLMIQSLKTNFNLASLEKAQTSFAETEKALNYVENLLALYQLKRENDGSASVYHDTSRSKNLLFLKALEAEYVLYANNIEKEANEKNLFFAFKESAIASEYASNLFKNTKEILDLNQDYNRAEERISDLADTTYEVWLVFYNTLLRDLEGSIQENLAYLSQEWDSFAQFLENEAKKIENYYTSLYAEGLERLNPEKKENPETLLALSYPAESILLFNEILKNIDADTREIDEKNKSLLESKVFHESLFSKEVEETSFFLSKLISDLENLKRQTQSRILIAEQEILLAERAKNEALLRVSQVQEAIRNNAFQNARDNLARARTKYNESLEHQESESLRKESDEQLILLANEITRKENEIVIRDVRNLKNEAKTAYYQGNFERAETLLIQAENRFAVTNVGEKDPEITNLLILVGTALSMKTGRVILPSAPLYPEMSQIMSLAKQYFEKGKRLLAENKRAEALTVLNDAKKKIRELQIVYPLNQEASLLTLRIDQLIDPAAFESFFAQRITQAKQDFRDLTKRQSAYTDLLDLSEINPRYPGLSDFIYNAEIEMGIRVRPPDQKALAESRRLTNEAALVVNSASRDEIQLNAALAKLNTALENNPDNEEAMVLKDRVQIMIGGKASIVLSSESEDLYQRAILELQRGNVLQAAGIVNTLLQKRENQNSSKIIDLKKKVDSLL